MNNEEKDTYIYAELQQDTKPQCTRKTGKCQHNNTPFCNTTCYYNPQNQQEK